MKHFEKVSFAFSSVICVVHGKQWQKVSSLWGGHVIKQNFSFAKRVRSFEKVECPVLFYFFPDLIFHKWSKDPITRLTNWHPHEITALGSHLRGGYFHNTLGPSYPTLLS